MNEPRGAKFAQRVFWWSGVFGVVVLAPMYFLEARIGRDLPPPITHPEYFYGFVGLALAWQVLFLMLASDPLHYRPLMIPAVLEKLAWGVPVVALFVQGRLAVQTFAFGLVDLTLGVLFVIAYLRTAGSEMRAA